MSTARTPIVIALILVGALAAGCVGPTTNVDDRSLLSGAGASEPIYEERIVEHTPFTASDGVLLDAWTVRPVVPEGVTVPVILQDSPYFGNLDPSIEAGGQAFSKWLVDHFVPRGYAVVHKSVRGTGESGGCFGMGDPREALDGYEVVETLGEAEWSNGKVAMIGKSYRGTTPVQTAVLNPPHLETIVPIAGITEWYLYVTSPGGVPYTSWVGFNTRYQATVGFMSNVPVIDGGDVVPYAEKLCPAVAELTATEAHSIATGEYNAGWESRNYAKDVAGMQASVYLVHGFQDFNVKPDQVAPWFNDVTSKKRALWGQWPHEYPYRTDWDVDLTRWFDHTLKGVENGVDREPLVKVEDSTGRWRYENQWPPTRATTLRLVPGADGSLAESGATASGVESATVTVLGNPSWIPQGDAGTTPHQFVAETDHLEAAVLVSGIPTLTVNASVDRPHATLVATLYDVAPSGSWNAVNWAFLDTRHRNSLRASEPMVPLVEEDAMTLRFFPMDHHFEAGHRIAVAVTMQHPTWAASTAPGASAVLRVGEGSGLDLPVVRGVVLEDPQPEVRDFDELPWYLGSA